MGLGAACPQGVDLVLPALARFGTWPSRALTRGVAGSTSPSVVEGWGSSEATLLTSPLVSLRSWDRNQKRRRHSGQQSGGRQQESQQPLTDLSPTTVSILGPYGDPLAPTPEAEESRQGQEGVEKLGGHGKSTAFQLNR